MPRLSLRLEADVADLVEKAQQTQTLSPAVDHFLASHQSGFFALFSRQIELIKSRSQDLRDAQITIFDKALLALTEHPRCLMHPASVKFFCEEYLNIDLGGPITQLTRTLQQTVQVPEALKQALPSSDDATMVAPDVEREIKKPSRPLPSISHLRRDMEPRLGALWSVYEIARADYLIALDRNNREKTITTAKFLRDTAENILLYLENKNADALMITELEGTFKHAKNTVVCLTGGKIRKFDKAEIENLKGVPRGPSRLSHPYSHQYPYPSDTESRYSSTALPQELSTSDRPAGYDNRGRSRHGELHARRDVSPYADQPTRSSHYSFGGETSSYAVSASDPVRRGHYSELEDRDGPESRMVTPEPETRREFDNCREERSASPEPSAPRGDGGRDRSRSRKYRRRYRSRSSDSRHYRPSLRRREFPRQTSRSDDRVPDQGRATASNERAKIPMPGRGHSGIPYGYNSDRLVDSYRPGDRGEDDLSMNEDEIRGTDSWT
ncbi:hypothetical protein G647_07704 [Cladophialophora carrionii CBS 160.54]|uniref:Uncharacterized protein n=1 Tax=Cladophialophora carrionii CBS 160.54 TaxID=1279043 RepID=V9D509_9EURO|nr:uncharacterized protein G647_07704 [Cladophialophora carrionii CBS 160.54]ETI21358.1 hypothetical protein G647_07704 [Cladophialophora carrionii CBS 160.54]